MYYTPIQVALILIIIICFGLWMTILIEEVTRIVKRGDARLTSAEVNNLFWLGVIALIALVAYIFLKEL